MLRVNHLVGFGKKRPVIGGGGGFDTDAQAFFTATGISDSTIQNAIDALVVGLKADSIWSKCIAIYPFVGGTSSTHAVNLKSPGTYDITWGGTVTHDANGITGNGSTGRGDTGINASTVLTLNDVHLGIYSRTNSTTNACDIGASTASSTTGALFLKYTDNKFYSDIWHTPSDEIGVTVTRSDGFFVATRRGGSDHEAYQNGSSIGTDTTPVSGARPNSNVYIMNRSGFDSLYSARNYAFATIGTGLTGTNVSNYHSRVETFQDALGRGVA